MIKTGFERINGCKVSHTFRAGFVGFYLGETETSPGCYKVWRQNPCESVPAWERQFSGFSGALTYFYEQGCNLANDQRRRTEGTGIRKKMGELERQT